jgi:hypothetical protein
VVVWNSYRGTAGAVLLQVTRWSSSHAVSTPQCVSGLMCTHRPH